MGNIRPSFIKSRALRLVEIYPDRFTDDFETNKHLVSEFTDLLDEDGNLMNKRMRNWIAGYITTYTQRRVD
jgi:small subunit ribosomal protein S17e